MRWLLCCLGYATSGASHVLAAAQWRFNLAVTIGAFGHLHLAIVIKREAIVCQRSIALPAGRIDTHSTFFAFVCCHFLHSLRANWLNLAGRTYQSTYKPCKRH